MLKDAQEFMLKVIDAATWDRAIWRGTAFLWEEGQPPDLAFIFDGEEPAREIFAGLRSLVGREDDEELIRVCIIEGLFDGNPNAYAVHLGPNLIHVTRHFGLQDAEARGGNFILQTRFLRMTPEGLGPLTGFKGRFQRFGCYRIIPLVIKNGVPEPLDELGIVKRELFFRKQSEITSSDEDAIALREDSPRRRK